jgi:hypothetical protein
MVCLDRGDRNRMLLINLDAPVQGTLERTSHVGVAA